MDRVMNAIEHTESASDRLFFGIVSNSSALAFGAVFASLQALGKSAYGFTFHVSIWTAVAGFVGAALGLGYWKIVSLDTTAKSHWLLRIASIIMALAGVAAFLYPLRFVATDALLEIARGLATAVVALSAVGIMLLRIKTFLDRDSAGTAADR
jgi:hypothetical protein